MDTDTTHRLDVNHYVQTGTLRCRCGWTPDQTRREASQKRAIGTHATKQNQRRAEDA